MSNPTMPHTRARGVVAAALAAAVLAVTTGGCDQLAQSDPPPGARYNPPPADLCQLMRMPQVAGRFDLTLAPWHDLTRTPATRPAIST